MTRIDALLVVACLTIATRSSAFDPRSLQLVQRAAERSNIRTTDVGPFRLRAHLHVARDQPIEAEYVLIWAAPDQWREEISTRDDHAIRIGGRNTVSMMNDSEQAQAIRSTARSLDVQAILYVNPNQTLSGVKNRRQSGNEVQCLSRAAKVSGKSELCFDPVSGVLVSSHSGDSTTHFLKYAKFKDKDFLRAIITSSGEKDYGAIEVEELTGVTPESSLFKTGAQYKTVPGCEHPAVPTLLKAPDPEYPARFRTASPQSVKMSATVDQMGGVEGISVIKSAGALDPYAIRASKTWKFAPATCGGIAVPFQLFIEVNFRTY